MEARCRHRSGRYFGVIPDAVQAPLGAPFRHSLMQRSSAICSAVGGVARSAATLVARWRRTFRRCLRRRAPLGAIVRAGCALRARCRRDLRLRSGGGALGAGGAPFRRAAGVASDAVLGSYSEAPLPASSPPLFRAHCCWRPVGLEPTATRFSTLCLTN